MAESDAEYLKQTIGPILAKGLAETVIHSPSDPVEFLAKWLLHHAAVTARRAKKLAARESLRLQKTAFAAELEQKQQESASVIQRQFRKFLARRQERSSLGSGRKRKASALLSSVEIPSDEDLISTYIGDRTEDLSDEALESELSRHRCSLRFRQVHSLLPRLKIQTIRPSSSLPPCKDVQTIIRAACVLVGFQYSKVRVDENLDQEENWRSLRRTMGTPEGFLRRVTEYDPACARGARSKLVFRRVRRLMRKVGDIERLKSRDSVPFAAFVLGLWITEGSSLRKAWVHEVIVKTGDVPYDGGLMETPEDLEADSILCQSDEEDDFEDDFEEEPPVIEPEESGEDGEDDGEFGDEDGQYDDDVSRDPESDDEYSDYEDS